MNFMFAFIISNIEMGKVSAKNVSAFLRGAVSEVCNRKIEKCSILRQRRETKRNIQESIARERKETFFIKIFVRSAKNKKSLHNLIINLNLIPAVP